MSVYSMMGGLGVAIVQIFAVVAIKNASLEDVYLPDFFY